jgi:sialic acid synthase SpsE
VTAIRHVELALGTGIKTPAACEIPNMSVARKSVVAARALPVGHQLSAADLRIKRPGNGLAPKSLPDLIGRTLRAAVTEDEVISWNHLA